MFRAILISLSLLWILSPQVDAASTVAASPAASSGLLQVTDGRPEIKELLSALKSHGKKKGKEDAEAIGVIDKLFREFEDCGPKDRAAIVKALEGCFKLKRTAELSPGEPDNRLYLACAVSLGRMAPESVKSLIKLLGHKSHRRNFFLQERLARSLGKTRDPRGVKPLSELLGHHEARMQAAGAQALGQYDELELKKRKAVFKNILGFLVDQKSTIEADPMDDVESDRWNIISGPFVEALQKLSGHNARTPEDWQRWWNKNKKSDWDAVD